MGDSLPTVTNVTGGDAARSTNLRLGENVIALEGSTTLDRTDFGAAGVRPIHMWTTSPFIAVP
jgi:hypothetical protein